MQLGQILVTQQPPEVPEPPGAAPEAVAISGMLPVDLNGEEYCDLTYLKKSHDLGSGGGHFSKLWESLQADCAQWSVCHLLTGCWLIITGSSWSESDE